MLRSTLRWFAFAAVVSGCAPDLVTPDGARLTCASDGDCPGELRCRTSTGLCVAPTTNEPPAVTIGEIVRSITSVSIPLTVLDPENDACELTVEADLGAGYAPITVAPTSIVASADGVTTTLTWDAEAAVPGGGAVYRSGLHVRVVAADPGAAGAPVTSQPFAYGNEPPVVEAVALDDDPVTGTTVVRFVLSDSAADFVDVSRFELSRAGDFSDAVEIGLTGGRDGNFPSGTLSGLSTLPAAMGGVEHSITWNSALAGAVASPGARVRLWVRDQPFGATSGPGASQAFALRNQTPPRVEPVFVKSDGALHNGLVPITYLLLDDEGDRADVLFEFSVDEGLTWAPCAEATLPASEGVEALAASAEGVEHTFVWDASANVAVYAQSVRVRATASGAASGPGPGTQLVQQRPVGLATGAGREVLFADPVVQVSGQSSPYAAAGDVSGDGIVDLVYVTLFGTLGVRLGNGAASVWSGSFAAATNHALTSDGGAVAIGDVTCDGVPDLVTVTNGAYFSGGSATNQLQVWRNAGSGTFTELAGRRAETGFASEDVKLVDLDGDARLDVVAKARFGAARVWFSGAACAFGEALTVNGSGATSLGVGDLDADGLVDLVFGNGGVYYGAPAPGRFVAGSDVPGMAAAGAWAVAVADVDGDGDGDVLAPGFAARSDGQRGFDATATFPIGAGPEFAAAADLNRDGLLDLLTVNFNGGDVLVQLAADQGGVWEGGFVDAFSVRLALGMQPAQLSLADLDEDGRLDLVVADRSGGVETLLAVDRSAFGAGSLKGAQVFPTALFFTDSVAPGDFDLDGIPDLLVSGSAGRLVMGSRAGLAPGGLFLYGEPISTGSDYTTLPAAGDFDADGFVDLVAATYGYSPPHAAALLFHGQPRQGGAPFVAAAVHPPLSSGETALCAASLRIDADAHLDLLVVTHPYNSSTTSTAYTFLGSAAGTFTAGPVTLLGANQYGRCELADVDGDGTPDLFAPNGTVWRVGATGALTSLGTFMPTSNTPFTVTDFDRDGIADVLVSTGTGLQVRRGGGASGVGNGTFTTVSTPGGFSGTLNDLAAADVDGDGLVDVVATTRVRTVAVALGQGAGGVGDGTFAAPVELSTPAAEVWAATLLDANGDATPDLAAVDPALSAPKALTVVTGMRTTVAPSWYARAGTGARRRLLGADTQPAEANLLGVPLGGSFTQLPFSTGQVGFIDHGRGSIMQSALFPQLLRGARLAGVPAQLTPLTLPWTWSGARSLARVVGPDGALRLEVRERFGPRVVAGEPQRTGLSLAGATQRGVVVELPLLAGRTAVDGKIRVYLRTLDYTRAAQWPGDALEGTTAGASFLPVEGGEPVIHPRFAWTSAAQVADLAAGTGPRFVVDRTRTPHVIRVALDAEATVEAFSVP